MNGDRDWQTELFNRINWSFCFQTLSACFTLAQLDTSNSISLLLFLLFFTSSFESIILYGFFKVSSDLFPGCMPKVSHKTLRNPVILSLTSWTIRATVRLWQKGHLNKKKVVFTENPLCTKLWCQSAVPNEWTELDVQMQPPPEI